MVNEHELKLDLERAIGRVMDKWGTEEKFGDSIIGNVEPFMADAAFAVFRAAEVMPGFLVEAGFQKEA